MGLVRPRGDITARTALDEVCRHVECRGYRLEAADVIVRLVSPDFIASNYWYEKEMTRAVERDRAGEAIVIPLIVRPCSWQQTPLGAVKAIPRDGKPVSTYDDSDDAWHEVETEIRRLIDNQARSAFPPHLSERH